MSENNERRWQKISTVFMQVAYISRGSRFSFAFYSIRTICIHHNYLHRQKQIALRSALTSQSVFVVFDIVS